MRHAYYHPTGNHVNSARWEIISDEYMDAIQAVELSIKKELHPVHMRCLLCRPCVGDAKSHDGIIYHLRIL